MTINEADTIYIGTAKASAAYVGVNKVWPKPVVGQSFITDIGPTTYTRTDGGFWAGFEFQVGSKNIQITALGRWVLSGNSQVHSVTLLEMGTLNVLAQLNVDTSLGIAGTFQFTPLSTPVLLTAGSQYYILSWETGTGDAWWNNSSPVVSSDASIIESVYALNLTFIYGGVSGNNAYVPPNFQYHL